MRAPNALQVVLAVRRRREEAEERALVALQQQKQQVIETVERLEGEIAAWNALRQTEVQQLLSGMHHQANAVKNRHLQQRRKLAMSDLERLEDERCRQMTLYRAARSNREVISELEQRRKASVQAQQNLREQKRLEDMFLARRVRD